MQFKIPGKMQLVAKLESCRDFIAHHVTRNEDWRSNDDERRGNAENKSNTL